MLSHVTTSNKFIEKVTELDIWVITHISDFQPHHHRNVVQCVTR